MVHIFPSILPKVSNNHVVQLGYGPCVNISQLLLMGFSYFLQLPLQASYNCNKIG